MADMRCPMCGKLNPSDLVICQYCQARLKPLEDNPRDSGSLAPKDDQPGADPQRVESHEQLDPTRSNIKNSKPTSASQDDLPDWIQEIRGKSEDMESDLSDEWIEEDLDYGEGSATDWLVRIRKSTTASDGSDSDIKDKDPFRAEEPDWMLRSGAEDIDNTRPEEEISDWLSEPRQIQDESKAETKPPERLVEDEVEEIDSEAIPDWVEQLDDSAESSEAESDDWLSQFEQSEEEPPESPVLKTPQGKIDQKEISQSGIDNLVEPDQQTLLDPDDSYEWLAIEETLNEVDSEISSKTAGQDETEVEDISEWLDDLVQEEVVDAPELTSPTNGEQVGGLSKTVSVHGSSKLEEELQSEEELPDWLQEALHASKSDSDEIGELNLPSIKEKQIAFVEPIPDFSPDETDDLALDSDKDSVGEVTELAAHPEKLVDIPQQADGATDLLQELAADQFEESTGVDESAEEQAPLHIVESEADDELLDWLSQAQISEDDSDESLSSIEEEPDSELSPVDLPSWLEAMRPVAALEEADVSGKREDKDDIEGAGPLAGLSGILPAEPDITLVGKPPAISSKLLVTKQQQAHMQMLEGLLNVEEEAQPISVGPLLTSQFVLRSLIFAVLLIAILLPIILGVPVVSLPLFSPETFDLNQMVASLPGDAPILFIVDYQPGYSGEMDAVSGAILDHLMIKGAYLILASTINTGPIQAQHLILRINNIGDHQYMTPTNYINLGFIPGGSSGILGFAQSPRQIRPKTVESEFAWDTPVSQTVNHLADFAMLIVATENPETAKAWIEQTQPYLGETPLVLVTSAQTEPMVRPYYETQPKQVQGFLSGLASSAEYQALLGHAGSSGDYWPAFSVSTLAALAMIVLGAVFFYVSKRIKTAKVGEKADEEKETQ